MGSLGRGIILFGFLFMTIVLIAKYVMKPIQWWVKDSGISDEDAAIDETETISDKEDEEDEEEPITLPEDKESEPIETVED